MESTESELTADREGVELVAVDSVRNRLYTLHTKGEVEYFDLASQGFRSIGRVGTTRFAQGSPIVSLQSVQRHESAPWCLVAVTAKGESSWPDFVAHIKVYVYISTRYPRPATSCFDILLRVRSLC